MSHRTDPTGEPVPFVVDGWPYHTTELRRTAAEILRLAGLDPSRYDLAALREPVRAPVRFSPQDPVDIDGSTRFVSIRRRADIA